MEEERFDRQQPLSEDYLRANTVSELKELPGPIRLVDYDPDWPRRFKGEAEKIARVLGKQALRIEHVGSTSVPGLIAKPIIDIVLAVVDSADEAQYTAALQDEGYSLHIREAGWHEHRMFKGPANDVNLHVFSAGCPEIDRMVMLRNWLRTSERDRELYAQTKRMLALREWKYTQNYADAKTFVIEEIISRARAVAMEENYPR
jgi:GrpB-like predicted nucleotidyltransferase (UPF0157 family)